MTTQTATTTPPRNATAPGRKRDALAPHIDKARAFAKKQPFATAALAGVVGLALLNTLRGR